MAKGGEDIKCLVHVDHSDYDAPLVRSILLCTFWSVLRRVANSASYIGSMRNVKIAKVLNRELYDDEAAVTVPRTDVERLASSPTYVGEWHGHQIPFCH